MLALPSGASAAAPKWSLSIFTFPSSFSSGAAGNATEGPAYRVVATNTGDSSTTAPYTITTTLPADVSPVESEVSGKAGSNTLSCAVNGQEIICTGSEPLGTHGAVKGSGEAEVIIPVDVATGTAGKGVISEASVEGGGAPPAKAKTKTAVGLPAGPSCTSVPTNVPAGGTGTLFVYAVNAGAAGSAGTSTITATLPEGLVPTGAIDNGDYKCSIAGQSFNCQGEESILAGQSIFLKLTFKADLVASGTLVSEVAVEGGGAGAQKSTIPVTISPTVAPFGFLTGPVGLSAPLTAADGAAATQAGSHPDQPHGRARLSLRTAQPQRRDRSGRGAKHRHRTAPRHDPQPQLDRNALRRRRAADPPLPLGLPDRLGDHDRGSRRRHLSLRRQPALQHGADAGQALDLRL